MSVLISNNLRDSVFDELDGAYLALYTSNPGADNSGTEVTGGSYAREQINLQGTGETRTNDAEIRLAGLPAGNISHFGILSASTNGNLLVYGQLSNTATVPTNGEIVFSIGTISIGLS